MALKQTLGRIVLSWQLPAALALALLAAFLFWVMPKRRDQFVSTDGTRAWPAEKRQPRQLLWEKPRRLDGLLPESVGGSFLTPRLAEGGTALYFSHRPAGGQADLYVSRFVNGRWQPAQPLAVNSAADDIGPALSNDGRQLYFYSNRPGGRGGFDIWTAERDRRAAGPTASWGQPRNLGPRVNSPADESDPALGADDLALYFSSDRTADMVEPARDGDPAARLAITIRAAPRLKQFDLYVTRRNAADKPWSAAEPIAELNQPDTNEGAPFFSRGFLYFASDRRSPHEVGDEDERHLDLYRARRVDGRWSHIEDLGPDINTPADETEPGLSPEGFRLVFSSDRDGDNALYVSSAQEVYARTEWDTRRLDAVAAWWWQILLLSLLLAACFAVLWFLKGWMMAKATAARFFLASLLLHCLLLLLLSILHLGREIAARSQSAEKYEVALNNLEQSTEQGPASFEQVADLEAKAPTPAPALPRRIIEVPPIPDNRDSDRPPPLPAQAAIAAPSAVVLEPTPTTQAPRTRPLMRRSPPIAPAVLSEELLEPAPLVQASAVQAAEAAVKPVRQATAMPVEREPAASGPTLPAPSPQPLPPAPSAADAELSATLPSQALPMRRSPNKGMLAERRKKAELLEPAAVSRATPQPAAAARTTGRRQTTTAPKFPQAPSKPRAVPSRLALAEGRRAPEAGAVPLPPPRRRNLPRRPSRPSSLTPSDAAARQAQEVVVKRDGPLVRPRAAIDTPRQERTPSAFPFDRPVRPTAPARMAPLPVQVDDVAALPVRLPPSSTPVRNPLARRRRHPDPFARIPERFRLRGRRAESVARQGGTKESEAAVERGLAWLAHHQNADGSWSLDRFSVNCKHTKCRDAAPIASDGAATGLALLPFLAAGHTHRDGAYRTQVEHGLLWLREHQDADGRLEPGSYRPFYGHAIAALALCEAYAMTRDPKLRAPAQKAIDYIVGGQHSSGGWRYTLGQLSDTSVTGWQVMVLRSGELAGLTVPAKTFEGVRRWLRRVEGNKPAGGLFGYQSASPTAAMTAQGLLCLQMLGTRRDDLRMRAGANHLLQHLPRRQVETSYYWYHATQVMFHMQGKYWRAWNDRFRDLLVADQIQNGPMAGTWTPRDPREKTGGRLYATALRILMLEVYYRYLPIYRQLESQD